MAAITTDLLQRPARETARRLALDWLDEASAALERLDDPGDEEALHDFRVPLRRLSSTLRAYRPQLKGSYRTVRSKSGLLRSEVEEEISRGAFQRIWPLTEARRLKKRRYAIEDEGVVWMIDVFLDRELILAEVEPSDSEAEVAIPEWLAPYVRREVTGKEEFQSQSLARRRPTPA